MDMSKTQNKVKPAAPAASLSKVPGGEVAVAIAVALSLNAGANIHDRESYIITIRRKRRDGDVMFID